MKTLTNLDWIYYVGNTSELIEDKVGKWMYFFKESDDINYIKKLCADAVEQGIVQEAKHTNPNSIGLTPHGTTDSGVCCFYLNCDDIEGHKKILSYFIKNNMIRKTKTSDFINLETGEWII